MIKGLIFHEMVVSAHDRTKFRMLPDDTVVTDWGVGHPDKQFLLAEDCLSLNHDNIGQISGPDDVRNCYCCIPVPVLFMGPIVLG